MPTNSDTSLKAYIDGHHTEIVDAFSAFARKLLPQGSLLTEVALQDHCRDLLQAISTDLGLGQTEHEQVEKAEGTGSAHRMRDSARLHADRRLQQGFTLMEVLAEFRALRASMLRLYEATGHVDAPGAERFNEALDEALTESMSRYSAQTDLYRDQFIGILGHDLRSPLHAITAGAAFLTRAAEHEPRQAAVAARILNSAGRMGRMISDLLDFTRMRLGGTIPLRTGPTDLQLVCEDVLLEVQSGHPDAVLNLECRGDVTGTWDADRLAQVVTNLAVNALDHGRVAPVTLVARGTEHEIVLTVHNEGAPIPIDLQPRIFDPLARGESDSTTNVGLGLFIARAIVVAHGGSIRVESTDEAGTTFEVTLPRHAAASM